MSLKSAGCDWPSISTAPWRPVGSLRADKTSNNLKKKWKGHHHQGIKKTQINIFSTRFDFWPACCEALNGWGAESISPCCKGLRTEQLEAPRIYQNQKLSPHYLVLRWFFFFYSSFFFRTFVTFFAGSGACGFRIPSHHDQLIWKLYTSPGKCNIVFILGQGFA